MAVGSTIGSSQSVERSHHYHHHQQGQQPKTGSGNQRPEQNQLTTDKDSLMANNGILQFLKNGSAATKPNFAKSNAAAIRQERAKFLGQQSTTTTPL